MMSDDALRDAVAIAISGAPFPSSASRAKAERVLATLRASGRLAPAVEGDVVSTAADAMGQAYQIVGQFIAALDDPECVPSEAEQIRVLDYLSSGKFDEEFLPWPGPTR